MLYIVNKFTGTLPLHHATAPHFSHRDGVFKRAASPIGFLLVYRDSLKSSPHIYGSLLFDYRFVVVKACTFIRVLLFDNDWYFALMSATAFHRNDCFTGHLKQNFPDIFDTLRCRRWRYALPSHARLAHAIMPTKCSCLHYRYINAFIFWLIESSYFDIHLSFSLYEG